MAFESFYGGRMGASFIIVKQFDAIDIDLSGESKYKGVYYATTTIGTEFCYYVDSNNNFIERTGVNYKNYPNWELTSLDGASVKVTLDGNTIQSNEKNLPEIAAEGMVQCFKQGGATTDIVNYGEYVIINTPSKDNPDNGRVYRRGMNYSGDLGGAEYIGQIIGPRGKTPQINMGHYSNITFEVAIVDPTDNPSQIPYYEYDSNSGLYVISADTRVDSSKTYYNRKQDATNIDYNEGNQDLIPGAYYEDEELKYNDSVTFAYTDFKDHNGNSIGCTVGFRLPYTMVDFNSDSVEPYYNIEVNPTTKEWINKDLISKDSSELETDGKWKHPFYQKWQVKVPKGIHGIDVKDIEIIHTKNKKGVQSYYTNDDSQPAEFLNSSFPVVTDAYDVVFSSDTDIYHAYGSYLKINYNGEDRYVDEDNCYVDVIRYKEHLYDVIVDSEGNISTDNIKYHELGSYNSISKVTLSENGILTVFYTGLENEEVIQDSIRWIDNSIPANCIPKKHAWYTKDDGGVYIKTNDDSPVFGSTYYTVSGNSSNPPDPLINPREYHYYEYIYDENLKLYYYKLTEDNHVQSDKVYYLLGDEKTVDVNKQPKGITIDEDGTVTVYYNTLKENSTEHETTVFENVLDWITDISLSKQGKFKVLFNNDRVRQNREYTAQLNWIDEILITKEGVINFYYNSNHTDPIYTSVQKIKVFNDENPLIIQTRNNTGKEGSGNQKVRVTYNTTHVDINAPGYNPDDPDTWTWINDTEEIGEPLNYIIETTIYYTKTGYQQVQYENHLLVYYSDPALRASLGANIEYPSSKYPGQVWNQWYDLGELKTDLQGVRILVNVESEDDLKKDGQWVPPELLEDENGHTINSGAHGWAVTLTTYASGDTSHEHPLGSLLVYDYGQNQWEEVQKFDATLLDPLTVIVKCPPGDSPYLPNLNDTNIKKLNNNGFWLAQETISYVE